MTELQLDTFDPAQHQSSAVDAQNYLVTDNGRCQPFFPDDHVPPVEPYRLYRFLTDLEDILAAESDDGKRVQQIAPLVRSLLISSDWLQMEYREPHPEKGWGVKFLYREPKFPITVQMVSWAPHQHSTIHNHATWGIVALISGEEKNTFWRRNSAPDKGDRLEKTGEQILVPGDIIGFTPEAIHRVEALGSEPTISFNLYGVTNYDQRFKFDPVTHVPEKF